MKLLDILTGRPRKGESFFYPLTDIVRFVEGQYLVELEVLPPSGSVTVGASAELERRSGRFINKLYYVGQREMETPEEFARALAPLSVDGKLRVLAIDGVSPRHYNIYL